MAHIPDWRGRLGACVMAALLMSCGGGGGDAGPAASTTRSAAAESSDAGGDARIARALAAAVAVPQRYLRPFAVATPDPSVSRVALFDPRGAGSIARELGLLTKWASFDATPVLAGGARELAGPARLFYFAPASAGGPAGIYRVKLGFDESQLPEFLLPACSLEGVTTTDADGKHGLVDVIDADCTRRFTYSVSDAGATRLPGEGGFRTKLAVLEDPRTGKAEKLFYLAGNVNDPNPAQTVMRASDPDGSNETPVRNAHPDNPIYPGLDFPFPSYEYYTFGAPDQTRRLVYTTDYRRIFTLTWDATGVREDVALPTPTLANLTIGPTSTSDGSGAWLLDTNQVYRLHGSDLPTIEATLPVDGRGFGTSGAWNTPDHVIASAIYVTGPPDASTEFVGVFSFGKTDHVVHRLDDPSVAVPNVNNAVIGVRDERVAIAHSHPGLEFLLADLSMANADGGRTQHVVSSVNLIGTVTRPVWQPGDPRQGGQAYSTTPETRFTTQLTGIIFCRPPVGTTDCVHSGGTIYEFCLDAPGGKMLQLGHVRPLPAGIDRADYRMTVGAHSNGRYLIEIAEANTVYRVYSARSHASNSLVQIASARLR